MATGQGGSRRLADSLPQQVLGPPPPKDGVCNCIKVSTRPASVPIGGGVPNAKDLRTRCVRVSDLMGDHAISCGIGGERIANARHNSAVQAGLGLVREPDGLFPGSDDRPVDVLIPAWSSGNLKLRKYEERSTGEGITFLPMAVDTLEGWHPEALAIIKRLGRQLARNVGKLDEEVVCHLCQRLGVLLVRDNVAMLCARTPTFPPAEVDGEDDSL